MGKYATAGSLVYANTWGTDGDTPRAYLTYVVALSDFPCAGLLDVWEGSRGGQYNTGATPVTQGYPIAQFADSGRDNLWVKFYDGTQTATDSFLTSTFGSDPDYPWHSTSIGKGVAYVIVTARRNPQIFAGFPRYKFALNGGKFYDQRLDSTAGGSGSHRFNDQTTWAHTLNPMVIANNILRGITYSGVPLFGLQDLPQSRVPSASWFASMNECDATINDIDGNSHAQYRCGAEIRSDMPAADIIDELLKACNGQIAEIGGVYKVLVGGPGASVMSFTDADVITSQPQTDNLFATLDQAVNGISGVYPEPIEAWDNKDAPIRVNQDAIDADTEIFTSVNYGMVWDASQVQRLQDAALKEASNQRRHAHTLPPPFFALEPLDTASWTSSRRGYSSKQFLVDQVTVLENIDIPVSLKETDATDYDFNPAADYLSINLTPSVAPDPPGISAPASLSAWPLFKSIRLNWTNPPNFDVAAVEIWWSTNSSFGSAVKVADIAAGSNSFVHEGLASATQYWYWVRFRDHAGTPSFFTPSNAGAGATATTLQLSSSDYGAASVPSVALAASIKGIDVFGVLPGSGSYPGQVVFLTTDNSLYRWTGSAWTKAVDGADLLANSIVAGTFAAGAINASAMIVDNLVVTGHIVNGAVTTGIAAFSAGPITVPADGSTVVLASGTYTNSGSKVLIDIDATAALTDRGSVTVDFQVFFSSNLLATRTMGNLIYLSPQRLVGSHDLFVGLNTTTFFISPTGGASGSYAWSLVASTQDGIDVSVTDAHITVKDWQR